MDGEGCFLHNTLVERLRLSQKYQRLYLHAPETGPAAKTKAGADKTL
ncbi:MAG: hypothetical protein ACI8R4_002603 [Paracoccaceae bacterium]|jgi:hypothetical protein